MKNTLEQPKTASTAADTDITQVLHRDHMKVDDLFFQFSKSEDEDQKKELVSQIIRELSLHAKAEEDVVYPKVRDGKEETEDMMDEADTEHHVVKFLLAELSGMEPSDERYDAKVTVLSELVKHHVQEEESEIFEKLKKSKLDLDELGEKFTQRKMELSQKPLPEESFPVKSSEKSH